MTPEQPSIPIAADHVAQTVNAHVREIIAAAERAAADLRREVEQEALRIAADIRRDAERDAQQIRARAEQDAQAHLEDARVRVQAFADGRVTRLGQLTDELLAKSEAIQVRLEEAVGLRQELEDLVSALRVAAATASAEAHRPAIRLPRIPDTGTRAAAPPSSVEADPPQAAPAYAADPVPEPLHEEQVAALELPPRRPSFDDPDIPFAGAPEHVRDVARDLPRPPRPTGSTRAPAVPPLPPRPEPHQGT